jgi:hypothetical protein
MYAVKAFFAACAFVEEKQMNVSVFVWLSVCTGAALWVPVLFYRCRKPAYGIFSLIILAAASGLFLYMARIATVSWVFFALYEAVLCFFSFSLIGILRIFDRYVPPEGILGAVCILLFGPVVVFNVAHEGWLCSLALLSNPQTAVGDICGINIFRTVYYDISPASDYFFIIPSWWKSALLFALTACILIGVKAAKVRWFSLKHEENQENSIEVN